MLLGEARNKLTKTESLALTSRENGSAGKESHWHMRLHAYGTNG